MVVGSASLVVGGSVERQLTGLQEFGRYKITASVFYDEATIKTSETVTTLPAGKSSSVVPRSIPCL